MIFRFGSTARSSILNKVLTRGVHQHLPLFSNIFGRPNGTQFWSTTAPCHRLCTKQSSAQSTRKKKPKKRPRDYAPEEDSLIINLRSQRKGWDAIQSALPHRSKSGLRSRWEQHLRPNIDFASEPLILRYTSSEDEKIKQLKQSGLSWKEIQRKHFPERTLDSLIGRFGKVLRFPRRPTASSRVTWTAEEKSKLLQLRNERHLPWREILPHFPQRTIMSLSSRHNKLSPKRPNRNRAFYSEEEDEILVRLRTKGTPYAEIAKYIPGRTKSSLSTRWATKLAVAARANRPNG